MAAQSLPHVELIFADGSIPDSRLQWSQAGSLGKYRTASSVVRLHEYEKTTTIAQSRSIVLDCAEEGLERLEICARIRSGGGGNRMATSEIQTLLVEIVPPERLDARESIWRSASWCAPWLSKIPSGEPRASMANR